MIIAYPEPITINGKTAVILETIIESNTDDRYWLADAPFCPEKGYESKESRSYYDSNGKSFHFKTEEEAFLFCKAHNLLLLNENTLKEVFFQVYNEQDKENSLKAKATDLSKFPNKKRNPLNDQIKTALKEKLHLAPKETKIFHKERDK